VNTIKEKISLFDALRIAQATPRTLAMDLEELEILLKKDDEMLQAIAKVKSVFGLKAKVRK
jgi:hypothetical protein